MNFGSWVQMTLKPLLESKIDKEGVTDPQKRSIREAQLISGMFPDRNAAKAVTEILQQFTKLSKDAEQMNRARMAMNMSGYNSGSWDYQVQSFTTQWRNLMTHLGAPMVEGATRMLARLNEVMVDMSRWAMANPEKVRLIGSALAAVAAGLTALGVVLVGGALAAAIGAGGWLVAGIAALGAAVATFAWMKDWNKPDHVRNADHDPTGPKTQGRGNNGPNQIKKTDFFSGGQQIGEMIANALGDGLKVAAAKLPGMAMDFGRMYAGAFTSFWSTIASEVKAGAEALPGMVGGAISAAFAAIGAAISSAIQGLVNFGKVAPNDGPGSRDGAITGPGGVGPHLGGPKRSEYVPPAPPGSGERKTAFIVDGRVLGHVVERRIASANQFANGTNDHDGRAGFSPVDYIGATG